MVQVFRTIFTLMGILSIATILLTIPSAIQAGPTTTPTPTQIPSPTTDPTLDALNDRINNLDTRLNSQERIVDTQTNVYAATLSRMESNMNWLLAIIAIVSTLVAFIGLGFVKIWIKKTVEDQLKEISLAEIQKIFEGEVTRTRKEWDPKFTNLYEEYKNIIRKNQS